MSKVYRFTYTTEWSEAEAEALGNESMSGQKDEWLLKVFLADEVQQVFMRSTDLSTCITIQEEAPTQPAPPPRLVIFIQGGLVAGVEASTDMEYMLVDRDVYGHDEPRALKDEAGEEFEAAVEVRDVTVDATLVAHYFGQV